MKMVFLDTNVVIDLLDKREGLSCTYATAAYILRKHPVEKLRFLDKWQSIQGYSTSILT